MCIQHSRQVSPDSFPSLKEFNKLLIRGKFLAFKVWLLIAKCIKVSICSSPTKQAFQIGNWKDTSESKLSFAFRLNHGGFSLLTFPRSLNSLSDFWNPSPTISFFFGNNLGIFNEWKGGKANALFYQLNRRKDVHSPPPNKTEKAKILLFI